MSEVLDEAEFRAYKQLEIPTAVYTFLRRVPDIDAKKNRFFSYNFSNNPDLTPEINITEAQGRAGGYTALKDQIGSGDSEQVIKDAYIPVIEGKLTGIKMLIAAADQNLEAFTEANIEEYGEPDRLIFDTLCLFVRAMAARLADEPQNIFVSEAAKQALDVIPDTWDTAGKIRPSLTEFRKLKKLYADFFDDMYEGIDLPESVTGEQLADIIEQVLENLGFDYEVEEQDKGVSTMSVNQVTEKVKVPFAEVYDRSRAKGLLGHELRIHLEETQNGKQQPLRILEKGLSGSSRAGEGKGVLTERMAYASNDEFMKTRRFFDIARRHISIGLARGLDGNGLRDFTEVFEIISAIDRMWELSQNPNDPKAAIVKALDRTWELLTQRTLKGVVGKGNAYFKDKIYAEEEPVQASLFAKNPHLFPYMNKGKYNLANPDDVFILKRVGVLPDSIEIKS